uniref:Uncharacterized protein n=1 Tax=Anguilla anguilla TaxID=7936 RepID=A0A0E9PMN1_ANGAN
MNALMKAFSRNICSLVPFFFVYSYLSHAPLSSTLM